MPNDTVAASFDRDGSTARPADLITSGILRSGVLLSVMAILAGIGLLYASHSTGTLPSSFPDTLPAVLTESTRGDPLAIIMLGLLILLATPVARVAVSMAAFAVEGDRLYVFITALVLAILLFSIFVAGTWLGQPEPIVRHAAVSFPVLLAASIAAGFVGALVGLGGGVFIVPVLSWTLALFDPGCCSRPNRRGAKA